MRWPRPVQALARRVAARRVRRIMDDPRTGPALTLAAVLVTFAAIAMGSLLMQVNQ